MLEQKAAVPELDDFRFAGWVATVPLVHEGRGPDVMVSPDEVDSGARVADPVQGLENGIESRQAEMGIVEPEIEDVSEQDQVVGPGGQFKKREELIQTLLLLWIGMQMKMGIRDDDGGWLFGIIHAA